MNTKYKNKLPIFKLLDAAKIYCYCEPLHLNAKLNNKNNSTTTSTETSHSGFDKQNRITNETFLYKRPKQNLISNFDNNRNQNENHSNLEMNTLVSKVKQTGR